MKGILRFLGKLGKGAGTIAGVALGLGGAAFGGGPDVAKCIEVMMTQPASAATFLGVTLAVFGIGRKAGWIGGKAS